MKRLLIFCQIILTASLLHGQTSLKVLFVADNKVNLSNTSTVLDNLAAIGCIPDVFNANDSARGPRVDELSKYNLVIWYCSSDGVGLYLWNGTDSDNLELETWLDNQPNNALWVMGTDVLYDRWTVPSTFGTGDFVYDYWGLQEYHAQSYGNDGGVGVPRLDLVSSRPQFSFSPVQWQFATAWWVDACVPAADAEAIYRMGPTGYAFSDYFSAILKINPEGLPRLTYFFDPALMDNNTNMQLLLKDAYRFLAGIVTRMPEARSNTACLVWPNPVEDLLHIGTPTGHYTGVRIFDAQGKLMLVQPLDKGPVGVATFPGGIYSVLLDGADGTARACFIKK